MLCPDKITTEEWLEAHRVAHSVGLRSNVTMMFGAIEQPVHWARHLVRTRDLQARDRRVHRVRRAALRAHGDARSTSSAGPGADRRGARSLLVHAVARIAYTGLIDNIQASWVKLGAAGARQLLQAGVNDLGGTLMDENISPGRRRQPRAGPG